MNRLLSQSEIDRFALWLEQEAATAEMTAGQIEKLGGGPTLVFAKRERTYAMAAMIVAKKLRSIEIVEIDNA